MTLLLGIDWGTTNYKVHLFTPEGQSTASASGELPAQHPQPGWVEQDTDLAWRKLCASICDVIRQAGIRREEIAAVAATGTNHLTLFDSSGQVLRPAILYGDVRLPPANQIDEILGKMGEDRLAACFGLKKIDSAQLVFILRVLASSKLLWLRTVEPEIFKKARYWVSSGWELINYFLTGRKIYSADELSIDREITKIFDIPEKYWGSPVHIGEVTGQVTQKSALVSGLNPGTPVVLGSRDSLCNFLGSGVVTAGVIVNQSGTTDVVAISTLPNPETKAGYPIQSILPDLWFISLSPLRGELLTWMKSLVLSPSSSYIELDRMAELAPAGSGGLICLPYFSGEKSVVHDPEARGILAGLGLQHTSNHLARAALEGIAFGFREIVETYLANGFPCQEIRIGGGGAKSRVWNQIKADVLGRPVNVLDVTETGCLGVAILAAKVAGFYPDLKAAAKAMVRSGQRFEPNPENRMVYEAGYQAYEQLYPNNRQLFPLLDKMRAMA